MPSVGQIERLTQDRVVELFQNQLDYKYLGNWEERETNSNIEEDILRKYLAERGYSQILIGKAIHELTRAATNQSKSLYDVNKDVYTLLRYGVKVKEDVGDNTQTVMLIEWKNPENNHFAIAQEVSVRGESTGEDSPTDKLKKYEVYMKMLAGKDPEKFEDEVKKKFVEEPAQMKLLIVVDKLLTGFDAPSATYLYAREGSTSQQRENVLTKWYRTCTIAESRIWLNLELAKKPQHCLEYIIVHEMVHLIERNHNDRFIACMDKFMPQWHFYKEELNRSMLSHEIWSY